MSEAKTPTNRIEEVVGDNGTDEQRKPIPIPPRALEEIRQVLGKITTMQNQLQAYVSGVQAGIGLKGRFDVDSDRGEFVPVTKGKDRQPTVKDK